MATKYVMRYHEAQAPIRSLTTPFGGQPVWLEEPCWPLSRMYARPMHFICQIALDVDAGFLPETPARMAYLFMTDWEYESPYPNTFDPDEGENALLL